MIPRLVNYDYLLTLKEDGLPEEEMPYAETFLPNLAVTYVLGSGVAVKSLKVGDVPSLSLPKEKFLEIGTKNLLRETGGRFFIARHRLIKEVVVANQLNSCAVFLRNYWADLSRNYNSPLIISIPTDDLLLFAVDNSPNEIEALCTLRDLYLTDDCGTRILTRNLFQFTNGDWSILAEQ